MVVPHIWEVDSYAAIPVGAVPELRELGCWDEVPLL
jgi:hypothetical protein